MYLTPLLAATSSSRRALVNLGLSATGPYNSFFRALLTVAQRHAAPAHSLQLRRVSEYLIDLEVLPTYLFNASGEDLIFPPNVLQRCPAPTFVGNVAASFPGEMVLLHPLASFTVWLNSTATFIWQRCDGRRTVREIAVDLRSKFPEETGDKLQHDLVATLATLGKLDLLTWEETT